MKYAPRAFTLIEILTVLGILSILIAVLLPVFFQVLAKSHTASCASNLRQVNIALASYVSDNDGYFPVIGTARENSQDAALWYDAVSPYLKSKRMKCSNVVLPGEFAGEDGQFILSGYALNARLNQNGGGKKLNLLPHGEMRLQFPSLTISVLEARAGIVAASTPDVAPWRVIGPWIKRPVDILLSYYHKEVSLQKKGGAERHSGGANYAFADGHVKWLKPEHLYPGAKSDGIHPGFGL